MRQKIGEQKFGRSQDPVFVLLNHSADIYVYAVDEFCVRVLCEARFVIQSSDAFASFTATINDRQ